MFCLPFENAAGSYVRTYKYCYDKTQLRRQHNYYNIMNMILLINGGITRNRVCV